MNVDDEYAELRKDLASATPTAHTPTREHRQRIKIKTWQVLLGGFILASVTMWTWVSLTANFLLRGGRTCHPDPRIEAPPVHGCGADTPPYFVLVAITTLSFAWLLYFSWRWLKGGPSGGGFFAVRALQERGEILSVALASSLPLLLLLVGWAICWGPGGIVGQALIALPMWLFGGGPRLPVLILAGKLVVTFFASVSIIGTLSITTQGS